MNTGGRPPLRIGEHGNIPTPHELGPSRYRARCRYRGHDGRTVTLSAFGQTKKAALAALIDKLERRRAGETSLDLSTKVGVLFDRWLAEIETDDTKAAQTKQLYRYLIEQHMRPRMGELRIGEATTGRCDAALQAVRVTSGPGLARSCRAVLNGAFGLAQRQDVIAVSPARGTQRISKVTRLARALTVEEAEDITDRLRTDSRALLLDLPDLVDFALDTGCRIGELLAIRERDCDLELATVDVRGTVVRRRGEGLTIQERTKSAAGTRLLRLPPQAVELLQRRQAETRLRPAEGVVFGSPTARTLRDPSNAAGDLREVMDRFGYEWVTFHTFRKTVATRLDEAGLSGREVADQLGHSQPSMTQNSYMGRKVLSPRAAAALER